MVKAGHGMSRRIDPVCVCRPEGVSKLAFSCAYTIFHA